MCCGLGEEERTKIRKKKNERKGKKRNKPHRGQKWVGWDERVSWDKQPHEIFFAVHKPFLTETAFYAKLAGRFSGSKTEVTRPIASKLCRNIQLINLKLLSKFHVARPNRSRVISKSMKFRTRLVENGRVKTEEHATRASVVPIILQLC